MRSFAKYNLSANCFITEITVVNCINVSLTDKTDIVIEQSSESFSDIDFLRDGSIKYYQSYCERINKGSVMQKIVIKFKESLL